jgi:hypothetical protein
MVFRIGDFYPTDFEYIFLSDCFNYPYLKIHLLDTELDNYTSFKNFTERELQNPPERKRIRFQINDESFMIFIDANATLNQELNFLRMKGQIRRNPGVLLIALEKYSQSEEFDYKISFLIDADFQNFKITCGQLGGSKVLLCFKRTLNNIPDHLSDKLNPTPLNNRGMLILSNVGPKMLE